MRNFGIRYAVAKKARAKPSAASPWKTQPVRWRTGQNPRKWAIYAEKRFPISELGRPKFKMGCPKREMGCPKPEMGRPKREMGRPEPEMGHPKPKMGWPKSEMGRPKSKVGWPKRGWGK